MKKRVKKAVIKKEKSNPLWPEKKNKSDLASFLAFYRKIHGY